MSELSTKLLDNFNTITKKYAVIMKEMEIDIWSNTKDLCFIEYDL